MQMSPLEYNRKLKNNSRSLRKNSTRAEIFLWKRLQRKQLLNTQFYRQKPIGNYIVDFYSASATLVIEIDGGQHFDNHYKQKDEERDAYLIRQGLKVLRFTNLDVFQRIDVVVEVIFNAIDECLRSANPPQSPFFKGGR